MSNFKNKLRSLLEIVLDSLLDAFIPYRYLAKNNWIPGPIAQSMKFYYVFNQKFQRIQTLQMLSSRGITKPKQVKVWWSRGLSNFGDELMPCLLANIAGVDCKFDRKRALVSIGSVVRFARNNSVVWGSGIIRKDENIQHKPNCLAVRGPLTRQKLLEHNVSCPEIYGDPAMLFPLFYQKTDNPKYDTLIAPHFKHSNVVETLQGYNYLDLFVRSIEDIEDALDKIISSERVITSSLHVFIFCVAYKIPVCVFRLKEAGIGGDYVKFDDFCKGVQAPIVEIEEIDLLDEKSITFLKTKARVYPYNWSPLPLLESLLEVCDTPTLRNLIQTISR